MMESSITWRGYALSGQSNARGNNDGNLSSSLVPMPKVSQLHDYAQGAYVLGATPQPRWWKAGAAEAGRVCPGAGMAQWHAANRSTEGFRLAKDGVGGSTISQWISTFGPRHVTTMQTMGWTFDGGLVWIQGETDVQLLTTKATYQSGLGTLFGIYRAAFPGLKVCIVMVPNIFVGSGWVPDPAVIADIRQAEWDYAVSDPLCTILDFPEYDGLQYDGAHRTADQNLVIGARCVAALENL